MEAVAAEVATKEPDEGKVLAMRRLQLRGMQLRCHKEMIPWEREGGLFIREHLPSTLPVRSIILQIFLAPVAVDFLSLHSSPKLTSS